MLQNFDLNDFNKFKNYFNIKKSPWEYDIIYLNKAKKYLNILKFCPWLRLAWVGNSTSMNYGNKESDIDLFLVFEENMMWFWRIFFTIFFSILGLRKTKNKHAWRFCLSFFATTSWVDFSSFAIINNTYNLFINKNNSWADFKNYENIINENKSNIVYKKTNVKNSNFILKYIDNILKYFFIKKTTINFNKLNKPYGIVINKHLLKFHNDDKRLEISTKLIND